MSFAPATYGKLESIRLIAWLIFLLAVCGNAFLWFQAQRLEEQSIAIQIKAADLDHKILSHAKFEVQPAFTDTEGLSEFEGQSLSTTNFNALFEVLNRDFPIYSVALEPLLTHLARSTNDEMQLKELQLNLVEGKLRLALEAIGFDDVEAFKNQMNKLDLSPYDLRAISQVSDQRKEERAGRFGNEPTTRILATMDLSLSNVVQNRIAPSKETFE